MKLLSGSTMARRAAIFTVHTGLVGELVNDLSVNCLSILLGVDDYRGLKFWKRARDEAALLAKEDRLFNVCGTLTIHAETVNSRKLTLTSNRKSGK